MLVAASIAIEAAGARTSGRPSTLDEAAGQLAKAVHRQIRSEEEQRTIRIPYVLPVRWHLAPNRLMDSWANIRKALPGDEPGPLALDGDISFVEMVYRRIPTGRLVILGGAGAGKTVLVGRLALALLDDRKPDEPVPVIVNVASWDPSRRLSDWMVDQLIKDHPELAISMSDARSDMATELVRSGRILPILDGLDEMPMQRHVRAIEQLKLTDGPIVITSRARDYAAAISGRDVVRSAPTIELDNLSPDDVANYLPRTSALPWSEILARIQRPGDQIGTVLRQVLSTPLMVSLARTAYSGASGRDPQELVNLLAQQSNPNPSVVERQLFAAYMGLRS